MNDNAFVGIDGVAFSLLYVYMYNLAVGLCCYNVGKRCVWCMVSMHKILLKDKQRHCCRERESNPICMWPLPSAEYAYLRKRSPLLKHCHISRCINGELIIHKSASSRAWLPMLLPLWWIPLLPYKWSSRATIIAVMSLLLQIAPHLSLALLV